MVLTLAVGLDARLYSTHSYRKEMLKKPQSAVGNIKLVNPIFLQGQKRQLWEQQISELKSRPERYWKNVLLRFFCCLQYIVIIRKHYLRNSKQKVLAGQVAFSAAVTRKPII